MLFYLHHDPPQGSMEIEKIEELLLKRFQAYCQINRLQFNTEDFDYRDIVAHLLMSVIAVDFPQFKNSFVNGEIVIFRQKLENSTCTELKRELASVLLFLKTLSQMEKYRNLKSKYSRKMQLAADVIEVLLKKSSHAFKKIHSPKCKKLKLKLPFTFVFKMVARKEVELSQGMASISCGEWTKILEIIFEFLLEMELELMERNEEMRRVLYEVEDDRLRQIVRRFVNVLNGGLQGDEKEVNAVELDEESRFFPPCMASLHQLLRRTHRLSYRSRYQYTLFLKDIGVPVDENISFWESEYSKPQEGSSCLHEWKDKAKRYKYQIEHLYGLKGSHGYKTSHSCDEFLGDLNSKMDGGCPFEHLTEEMLRKSLPKKMVEEEVVPDVEDIFMYKNCGLPQKACAAYLKCQMKVLPERKRKFPDGRMSAWNMACIMSPLQFYNMAKALAS